MGKFESKSEVKRMLLDNISLMEDVKTNEHIWVEFHEINEYIENGFILFNEEKRILYDKLKK